jgi:hypothetical protein
MSIISRITHRKHAASLVRVEDLEARKSRLWKSLATLGLSAGLMANSATSGLSLDLGNSLRIEGLGQSTFKTPAITMSRPTARPQAVVTFDSVRMPTQIAAPLSREVQLSLLRQEETSELAWFAGMGIVVGINGIGGVDDEVDVRGATTSAEGILREGRDRANNLTRIRKAIRELGGYPAPLPPRPIVNNPSYEVNTTDRAYHRDHNSAPATPRDPAPRIDLTVKQSIFHDELMRQGFPSNSNGNNSWNGNDRNLYQR